MSATLPALPDTGSSEFSSQSNSPCHRPHRERRYKQRSRYFPAEFEASLPGGFPSDGRCERDRLERISEVNGLLGGPSGPRNHLSCIRTEYPEKRPIP